MIFFNFLRSESSSCLNSWQPSRGWKGAHLKFSYQKTVKFEGSRILRYGVISDWKMKFIQKAIEKFSAVYNNFYYPVWFFENFFTDPYKSCQTLGWTSKPKNEHIFLNFLLKRILKFWQRIWILDRKLASWPSKVWGVQDAPLRRYKRLKNEISTGRNRKIFSSLKKFILPRVNL